MSMQVHKAGGAQLPMRSSSFVRRGPWSDAPLFFARDTNGKRRLLCMFCKAPYTLCHPLAKVNALVDIPKCHG